MHACFQIALVETFMSEDDALQEPGFYLTTLQMAARFIVQQEAEAEAEAEAAESVMSGGDDTSTGVPVMPGGLLSRPPPISSSLPTHV